MWKIVKRRPSAHDKLDVREELEQCFWHLCGNRRKGRIKTIVITRRYFKLRSTSDLCCKISTQTGRFCDSGFIKTFMMGDGVPLESSFSMVIFKIRKNVEGEGAAL